MEALWSVALLLHVLPKGAEDSNRDFTKYVEIPEPKDQKVSIVNLLIVAIHSVAFSCFFFTCPCTPSNHGSSVVSVGLLPITLSGFSVPGKPRGLLISFHIFVGAALC